MSRAGGLGRAYRSEDGQGTILLNLTCRWDNQ